MNFIRYGSIYDESNRSSIYLLGYALETAAFTLNRVPSKAVEKTPNEMWTGKRPSLSFLKIWGCEAYVKRQVSKKLEPKSDKCLFVGYPKETKGYYFYNPIENKVFVARNGVFQEREFISKGTSGSKVQLEEVREPQDNIELPVDTHSQQTIVNTPPIAQNLRLLAQLVPEMLPIGLKTLGPGFESLGRRKELSGNEDIL